MSTKSKQIIFTPLWLLVMTLTLHFYRFKFGLFQIVAFFIVVGVILQWLLFSRRKPN